MSARPSTHREGFTIIELLLVAVLGLMVMAGAYTTLLRQSEAYTRFNAMTGTQQDTRTGADLLAAELRELSTNGADLLLATSDSVRFRAMRSFGVLCDLDKVNMKLTVARLGVQPFQTGDSLLIYLDKDSLLAKDDVWQRLQVSNIGSVSTCGTTLGLALSTLLPNSKLTQLNVGTTLKKDSVYVGAPVRAFNTLTYATGTWDGETMLMRRDGDSEGPLLGPLKNPGGIQFSYYDTAGVALTSFPLSAADRAIVRRIRVTLRAERWAGRAATHEDSLVADIFVRGS